MTETKRDSVNLSSRVRALLMQAWRLRWTDVLWNIQLKKLLSAHKNETCDLADILLRQATTGSSPNALILSYLQHTVLSQLITYGTVLKLIAEFDGKEVGHRGDSDLVKRPYCVLALLHLVEKFSAKISFSCGQDCPLQLSCALFSTVPWMLSVIVCCLAAKDLGEQPDLIGSVIDASCGTATALVKRPTVAALLQIARAEDPDLYHHYQQAEANLRGKLSEMPAAALSAERRDGICSLLGRLADLFNVDRQNEPLLDATGPHKCSTVNGLVAMEAVLNSNTDIQPFVNQTLMISRLMKLRHPQLYFEIMRACFMGFVDAVNSSEELKWATFTFLKVQKIIKKMHQQAPGVRDLQQDIVLAVEMLLQQDYLLDQADIKQRWDCCGQFIKDCEDVNLITKQQSALLKQSRQAQRNRLLKADLMSSSTSSAGLIMRAEATVGSILRTLDADHQKNQEPLVGVLSQMLTGRSFEIITSAAACMEELSNFTFKLIRTNEFARQHPADPGAPSVFLAQLFDITFLMVCHIFQKYGMEVVSSHPDSKDAFIVHWAQNWLPEDDVYRSLETMAALMDPAKVDTLLVLMLQGGDLRSSSLRWPDVCLNAPFAVHEVLFAWEHGALSWDKVKLILDGIKSRTGCTCLCVATCALLCGYMDVVDQRDREKALTMVEHLTRPRSDQASTESSRASLATLVMERITNNVLPVDHLQRTSSHVRVPVSELPVVTLQRSLRRLFKDGWMRIDLLHTFDHLLAVCGPRWFCENTILEMLENRQSGDLREAVSLVLVLFHMDLERLTLSLLKIVLPHLLLSAVFADTLTDPMGLHLAKLCVLCIASVHTSNLGQTEAYIRRSRKRICVESEGEDAEEAAVSFNKSRKVHESQAQLSLNTDGFNFDELARKEDSENSSITEAKDQLSKALASLLRLMDAIVHDQTYTARTTFIVSFIKEAMKGGNQYSRFILQHLLCTTIANLMRMIPKVFTNGDLLEIYDLSLDSGRASAASAVCHNAHHME